MSVARSVVLALAVAAEASAQESLKIQHQPPQCLVPERYSELRAKIDPISNVLRARILFRTDPLAEPHAITMKQDGQEFVGVLPRPLATLNEVTYWVEAADPALVESVTDEVTIPVQASCPQAAKNKKSARADVTAPLGSPLVPVGFASDVEVATFKEGGSSKPGVFNIGPKTSLIAALAVGAGAVAVAAQKNPGGNPPERPVAMEPVGVTFIESTPAPGGTVRLGQGSFRVMVRLVIGTGTGNGGAPTIEFRQNPGGPICMTNAFQLPNEFMEPFVGRNVAFTQFRSTGACGDTFEVTVVRVALVSFFGAGQTSFTTGTAEVPDLALRYQVMP